MTAEDQSPAAGWREHPDFSTYSDKRLELDQQLIEDNILWAKEDKDETRAVYYEQEMRMLQAERGRRNGNAAGHTTGQHLTSSACDPVGLAVGCSLEEDPEEHSKSIAFPSQAWTGPFAAWREIVTPCTESPEEYLWASCLVTLGLVLGRDVRIENPRPVYPNFYALLMGSTGDDRKSTALSFAKDSLFHLGMSDQVDILPGIQSSESIYESLARMDGAKSLIYCDEFRSLLSVAKRKGTQDLIPRLSSLYYCPAKESLNRREDSTVMVNPFLSMIAATPIEYVHDLLSNLEIEGGFLNRFLTITGEVREWKAIAPRPTGWDRFVREVKDIHAEYEDKDCLLQFTDDSAELWTKFYKEWKTGRQKTNDRDRRLTARIDEHILKIAMVYSAIEKRTVISKEALTIAIAIGKWLQDVSLRAFSEVGKDSFSRGEKVVLDLVKSKGRIYRRYLQQWVHKKHINGEMLSRIVGALVKNGHLKEGVDETGSGQKRPWVEYVPSADHTS